MRRDAILQSIIQWAAYAQDVLALIQTGSLVRADGSADEHSDLDIEVIALCPEALAADNGWLGQIAPLITVLPLGPDATQRWATRLAIYAGGVKVDYTLAAPERLQVMVERQQLDSLYERGYTVLLDKAGLTAALPAASGRFPERALPSQLEFGAAVEEFWFEAFHVPRYLARGELWLAKQRDWTMKQLLLQMLEWHAVAMATEPLDVWHIGTRLECWTDPGAWAALQSTFGRFDAADARRAFLETHHDVLGANAVAPTRALLRICSNAPF